VVALGELPVPPFPLKALTFHLDKRLSPRRGGILSLGPLPNHYRDTASLASEIFPALPEWFPSFTQTHKSSLLHRWLPIRATRFAPGQCPSLLASFRSLFPKQPALGIFFCFLRKSLTLPSSSKVRRAAVQRRRVPGRGARPFFIYPSVR